MVFISLIMRFYGANQAFSREKMTLFPVDLKLILFFLLWSKKTSRDFPLSSRWLRRRGWTQLNSIRLFFSSLSSLVFSSVAVNFDEARKKNAFPTIKTQPEETFRERLPLEEKLVGSTRILWKREATFLSLSLPPYARLSRPSQWEQEREGGHRPSRPRRGRRPSFFVVRLGEEEGEGKADTRVPISLRGQFALLLIVAANLEWANKKNNNSCLFSTLLTLWVSLPSFLQFQFWPCSERAPVTPRRLEKALIYLSRKGFFARRAREGGEISNSQQRLAVKRAGDFFADSSGDGGYAP